MGRAPCATAASVPRAESDVLKIGKVRMDGAFDANNYLALEVLIPTVVSCRTSGRNANLVELITATRDSGRNLERELVLGGFGELRQLATLAELSSKAALVWSRVTDQAEIR